MLDTFQNWYKNRHEYAREWKKKTGGKVLGYFCTFVPEEILYAANILPVRVLGNHEPQSVTEPHIFAMYCPFCRDCLAQGLQGKFDYLDGIIIAQSCLHLRQAFSSWKIHIPTSFAYYLPFPHTVQTKRAYPYLTTELEYLKSSLVKWTGEKISDSDIEKAVDIYNQNRRLLKEVYNLRKNLNPPITGTEVMYLVLSSQVIDKKEHNNALKELLVSLENRNLNLRNKTRLMILGSENDDTNFMKMVEGLNAVFVIDDHCTGTRYFYKEVEKNEDVVGAIAKRYIEKPPCPSKDWPERWRIPHIISLAKEFNVKGAIIIQQKFCDPHELDIPAITRTFNNNGIKTLFLEFDVTVPFGQFKVRVEAFLEMLEQEDLF